MKDVHLEAGHCDADSEYLEMISLLQDEIARLEGELASRQELTASSFGIVAPVSEEPPEHSDECERLTGEVASRDETISMLMEQLRLVEEAERAAREEWEQLAGWLAEIEDRVDRKEQEAPGAGAEQLSALQRQAEDARAAHARDRSAWDRERRELGRENERLGALLARQAAAQEQAAGQAQADPRLAVLESENSELRRRYRELEAEREQEVQSLTESLETARRSLDELGRQSATVEDERARERGEFEVAISSLRAQAARTSLHAEPEAPSSTSRAVVDASGALEADIRIRVFRQHLREIHDQEEENRKGNRLGARLSRLWSRTAASPSDSAGGKKP